jgi:plasmid stabilization system protein ParE
VNRATLRLSDAAVGDILEQAEWYHQQSGHMLAKRWESAVTAALLRIVKNPQSAHHAFSMQPTFKASGGCGSQNFPNI